MDIDLFFKHAIQLERDAARRFEDLSHAMQTAGNRDLQQLFARLGELSRMHLQAVTARSGFRDLPEISKEDFVWPEGVTPEAARYHGVDDMLDVQGALELALEGERGGFEYYSAVAEQTEDPEVRRTAHEFAEEEAAHVRELERWMARAAS